MFDICPICGSTIRVRLLEDWRERVNRGEPVPIVGCGNPWHYHGVGLGSGGPAILESAQPEPDRFDDVCYVLHDRENRPPEPDRAAALVESADPPLGFIVWRAWFEGMESQGRHVAPSRRSWGTLPEQDRDLDAVIESRVAVWVLERHAQRAATPEPAPVADGLERPA